MLKFIFFLFATFFLMQNPNAQQFGTMKDSRDGQDYKTVKIGEQIWMAENLNVDKFRNGDPIPQAKTKEEWKKAGENKQPAWCYYENDPANGAKYGKLYNCYAVRDPRGLAPVGYHIPSNAEWIKLVNYLGLNAGTKMKSKSGWNSYSTEVSKDSDKGTNASGFSGLPGGFSNGLGSFFNVGYVGYWWSSTDFSTDNAVILYLNYNFGDVIWYSLIKPAGISVRCLRG